MKPIIKQEQQDTILTSEITNNHLIVAIIEGEPCILGRGYYELPKKLIFFYLYGHGGQKIITEGNGRDFHELDTIQKMVEYAITANNKNKLAVYNQDDWKLALQWLIDNA